MKRNWKRIIFGGLYFTSAMFVFQACYGTPQDFGDNVLVEGKVKSKATGLPIEGILVMIADSSSSDLTKTDGTFSFYTGLPGDFKLVIQDIDTTRNGEYLGKEIDLSNFKEDIYLDVSLDAK